MSCRGLPDLLTPSPFLSLLLAFIRRPIDWAVHELNKKTQTFEVVLLPFSANVCKFCRAAYSRVARRTDGVTAGASRTVPQKKWLHEHPLVVESSDAPFDAMSLAKLVRHAIAQV